MRAYSRVYNFLWDNALFDTVADALTTEANGALTICDIGSGTGLIAERLIENGFRVVATEPDASMRRRFMSRLPEVECLSLGIMSLQPDTFPVSEADCLIAVNVIHMTESPADSLNHLRHIARDHTLIVVTPREDVSLSRTFKALREEGVGLPRALGFVAVHVMLAPLTLLSSSGVPCSRIEIGSPLRYDISGVMDIHVWPITE